MKILHGAHNISALVILLIVLTFLTIPVSSGIAEEKENFLDDPAKLKFRVQDATETRERLNAGGVIIVPQKTFKLIIVTLAGTSPCDCRVAFEPREFTLAYLTPFVAKPGGKRFAPNLTPAAFLLHAGSWSVVPHDSDTEYTISAYSLKSGQEFVLTIGFLVRHDVQSFVVRYPKCRLTKYSESGLKDLTVNNRNSASCYSVYIQIIINKQRGKRHGKRV